MRLHRHIPLSLIALVLVGGCGLDSGGERATPEPAEIDPLYRDFIDGKLDAAGHPIGATVFEAEGNCDAEVGFAVNDFLSLDRHLDEPGSVCAGQTDELGEGAYVVNLRTALREACAGEACGPVFRVRVLDRAGDSLASHSLSADDYGNDGVLFRYEDISFDFWLSSAQAVSIEIEWRGGDSVALDYVEVFRQDRQLVLSPPSGVLDPGADFRIEIIDPPDGHSLRIRCDDVFLDDLLSTMLADGSAIEEITDFRRIVTAPTDVLFETCAEDTQIVVELFRGTYASETSEVHYTPFPAPCDFAGSGDTRVLITGFVPFPAGSQQDNSSMEAVLAFDPATVPEASVMKMILPVEFIHGPGLVEDAIERCAPEVVVGFGQGRGRVDLERIGYNTRDTGSIFGGFPDNRGLVVEPRPIRDDGPEQFMSELPMDLIEEDLVAAGINVNQSDDPGRYVCNDHLYTVGTSARADALTTGFVHMPYIRSVSETRRAELATVVESVVRRSVASHASTR